MKKLLPIILIFIFLTSCEAISNISTDETTSIKNINSSEPDESIFIEVNKKISDFFREYFKNNDNYILKENEIFGLSSEGGNINSFWDKDILKMIDYQLYGELGNIKKNYYIINEKIIYVVVTTIEYDKPFYLDGKIENTYLNEYFIIDKTVMEYDFDTQDLIYSIKNDNMYTDYKVIADELKNIGE